MRRRAAGSRALSRAQGIAFAWPALLGFLRLSTRRGIFVKPLALGDALGVVDAWLHHLAARILAPTERHAGLLASLLLGAGRGGNLLSDAQLAALAIEHGAELGTFDHDFERFAGLRVSVLK